MALYRPGSTLGPPSGRIGGLVACSRRASGVLRGLPPPRPAQGRARQPPPALARRIRQAWRSLTPAQQTAWNTWADAFGDDQDPAPPRPRSGFTAFLAHAAIYDHAGLAPLTTPSDPGPGNGPPALLDFNVNPQAGSVAVRMLEPFIPAHPGPNVAALYLGKPTPPRRTAYRPARRLLGVLDLAAPQPGVDRPPVVYGLPGDHPEGWHTWAWATVADGRGGTSSTTLWPVPTPPPGSAWVMRLGWQVLPVRDRTISLGDTLRIAVTIDDPTEVVEYEYDLQAGPASTVGGLRTRLLADGIVRVLDYDATQAAAPSANLLPVPRQVRTTTTQPVGLALPIPGS